MNNFNILAVSKMTNMSPHTIRAWERRYGAVSPIRESNGRRVYSYKDVKKLKFLSHLVFQGHGISKIANLDTKSLKALISDKTFLASVDGELNRIKYSDSVYKPNPLVLEKIIKSLREFDLETLTKQLQQANYRLSPKAFALEVCLPLIHEVGSQISNGLMDISQEHALSALIKKELIQTLHESSPVSPKGSVILTTPDSELHEFGILVAGILFSINEFKVHYLGVNLPSHSLDYAVKALRPTVITLSATSNYTSSHPGKFRQYLTDLLEAHKIRIPIIIGGSFQADLSVFTNYKNLQFVSSFQALDALIESLASRIKEQLTN